MAAAHNAGYCQWFRIIWLRVQYDCSDETALRNHRSGGLSVLRGNHGATCRKHSDLAGTIFDQAWVLNAAAYAQLAPFGKKIGIPFLMLGAILAVAGTG